MSEDVHHAESPTRPPEPKPVSGLVLVDKPASGKIKSMTVVRAVKRKMIAGGQPKSIKVGHAGTLDPLASGMLIVLVGKATRLCDQLMADEKEYLATLDLSKWSPTDDLERSAEPNPELPPERIPTPDQVQRALAEKFTGVIQQRPPDFSAIWVDGKRAYHLARKGRETNIQPRPIIIHSVRIVAYRWPMLTIDVCCGKGTYIRSMARDIGLALTESPAVLTMLRRTRIGAFHIDHATPLDALPEKMTPADLTPPPAIPSSPPSA